MRRIRILSLLAALLLPMPAAAWAQRLPAVVTGRVTIPGEPRADSILVRIETANVGVSTDSTGRYRMVVPASRFADGDSVTVVAVRRGLLAREQRIQLVAGQEVVADFWTKRRMRLGEECYEFVFGTRVGVPSRPVAEQRQLCVLSAIYAHKRGTSPPP